MKCVFVMLLCLPLALLAQKDAGFVINGTIPGLPEKSIVYIAGSNEQDTIASTTVKQNSFILKGKFESTDGAMLVMPAIGKRIFLYVGNETVNINASDNTLSDVAVT